MKKLLHFGLVKPFKHPVGYGVLGLNTLKTFFKSHVELVKVCLALNQNRSCRIIKAREGGPAQVLIHGIVKRYPFG